MSEKRGAGAVPLLAILVALLLPAAVFAAANIDAPATSLATGGQGAGAAELSRSGLAGEEAFSVTEAQPATTTTSPAAISTLPRPSSTTTPPTTRPAGTGTGMGGTTQVTLPPGVPPPPVNTGPSPIPNIAPASEWSGERDGVTARVRIDPPAPVPGQTVTFTIDYASAEPCCMVMLDFGDGSAGFSVNNGAGLCADLPRLTSGAYRSVTTRAYPAGAYKLTLSAMTGDRCSNTTIPPGGPPPMPFLHSVAVYGCVGVGTAGHAGCSPFPTFGPNDIISPILDPACQIRSDCTRPSPPR